MQASFPQTQERETEQCPKCGNPVSPTALEGFCPSCLLGELFSSQGAEPPPLPPPHDAAPSANTGPPPLPELNQASTDKGAVPPPLPQPKRLGRYELGRRIAQGGQGAIYLAKDFALNRTVAVKVMHAGRWASESERTRFRTEAQAAANLKHPNIVAIHELGEHEDALFIAMDYVEGDNLQASVDKRLREQRAIAPLEAAGLVKQLHTPVYWAAMVRTMITSGATQLIECGPGKVLAGLTRRIAKDIPSFALADRASLEQALKEMPHA